MSEFPRGAAFSGAQYMGMQAFDSGYLFVFYFIKSDTGSSRVYYWAIQPSSNNTDAMSFAVNARNIISTTPSFALYTDAVGNAFVDVAVVTDNSVSEVGLYGSPRRVDLQS